MVAKVLCKSMSPLMNVDDRAYRKKALTGSAAPQYKTVALLAANSWIVHMRVQYGRLWKARKCR